MSAFHEKYFSVSVDIDLAQCATAPQICPGQKESSQKNVFGEDRKWIEIYNQSSDDSATSNISKENGGQLSFRPPLKSFE